MSLYFMEIGKPEVRKYTKHGRTKQSQKNETDINLLLERSAREGTMSHLEKYEAQYADYSDFNFEGHINTISRGQTIFEELPAEVKREFEQSPAKFFRYVTDPANSDNLAVLLPKLAARGTQMPQVGVIEQRSSDAETETETSPTAPPAPTVDSTTEVGDSLDTPTG